MDAILIFLSMISTLIGTIALYIFLIKAFSMDNSAQSKSSEHMRVMHEKTVSFLIALLVSETLGIFFLLLSGSLKNMIMTLNGFAFLIASCICSFIIIVFAVRGERIDIRFWLSVQSVILFASLGLIRISIVAPDRQTLEQITGKISLFLQFFSVIYFCTTIIAVLLILVDSIKLEIQYNRQYLIWAIVMGIGFGTGLYLISNNWRALL